MLMLAWAGADARRHIFSLCVPALGMVQEAGGSEANAALVVAAGIVLGALGIWGLHRVTPHLHFHKGHEGPARVLNRHLLFVLAISLHNLPEGMSVGVAYGADAETGFTVALGMALQNVPEGFAVAAAMQADGASLARSVGVTIASGLISRSAACGRDRREPQPGALAVGARGRGRAMLYVILADRPETHGRGREQLATLSLVGVSS